MKLLTALKTSLLVVGLICSAMAHASSWNWTAVEGGDSEFFFDAESVQKAGDTVTVWVKLVKKDLTGASAMRWKYDCAKRTMQSSNFTRFDGQNKFLTSSSKIHEQDVLPDSLGDVFMRIACSPRFPELNADSLYRPAPKNDVFATTKAVVESDKSLSASAPK